jgi:hypothetical protein
LREAKAVLSVLDTQSIGEHERREAVIERIDAVLG